MEKNRSSKVLAIIALLVSAIGLSLGFAAFSQTLTISTSATVKPNSSDFKVVFSSQDGSVATNPVVGVANPTTLVTSYGTISNLENPVISGLGAEFTAPGQKVVYTFYAANVGEYDAYLQSIIFANASSGSSPRVCTAKAGTTDSYVQSACNDITLKVKVGDSLETAGSVSTISGHKLAKGDFELITVTIEYAVDGARADGDFSVDFGDITLNYGSNQ